MVKDKIKFVCTKFPLSSPFVVVPIILLTFVLGVLVGANRLGSNILPAEVSASLYSSAPKNIDLDPVWKVWYLLDSKFVPSHEVSATSTEKLTKKEINQKRVWGLAQGLAASTDDPYTIFFPPSDAEIFTDDISGEFEGVGMEIGLRDGLLTVVSPLKGTPAFTAGIKAKDRILKIDGVSTKNININTAVKKIRGPKDSIVEFEILREGEPELLNIKVKRGVIEIPTIETKTLPTGEFVIELMHFSANSADLFRKAILEFKNSGKHKLILDLRGNPGGYLGSAVDIASWFLPKGSVVVTEDYGKNGKKIVHRSRGYDIFNNKLDMVILVDKGSASASEILSGALKEYKKAKLIGTNTYGKGSVQELVNITDNSSLKVTVALWLLPGGVHIGTDGIEPNIKVDLRKILEDRKIKEFKEGEDPIMDRAVEYFKTGE